jgi:hypothetical protein
MKGTDEFIPPEKGRQSLHCLPFVVLRQVVRLLVLSGYALEYILLCKNTCFKKGANLWITADIY